MPKAVNTLLPTLLALVRDAGRLLLEHYQKPLSRQKKKDGSWVTEADLAANQKIKEGLAAAFPEIAYLSEEEAPPLGLSSADPFWLVDPLDGTEGFLKGGTEFVINIALIRQGRPDWGVIHAPLLDETLATDGLQTWLFRGKTAQALPPFPPLRTPPIGLVGNPKDAERLPPDLPRPSSILFIRSALKFLTLAKGEAHLYWRPRDTSGWDIAAGEAILRALGGKLVGWKTRDPFPYSPTSLTLKGGFVAYAYP